MAEKTVPTTTDERDVATRGEDIRGEGPYLSPPVDIYEEDDVLKVIADLPGVDKDSVDVRVNDNILTIQGKAKDDTPGSAVYREYELGRFFRQFELSDAVDADKITADLKHGVLTLVLPKAEKAKPRQISVE